MSASAGATRSLVGGMLVKINKKIAGRIVSPYEASGPGVQADYFQIPISLFHEANLAILNGLISFEPFTKGH